MCIVNSSRASRASRSAFPCFFAGRSPVRGTIERNDYDELLNCELPYRTARTKDIPRCGITIGAMYNRFVGSSNEEAILSLSLSASARVASVYREQSSICLIVSLIGQTRNKTRSDRVCKLEARKKKGIGTSKKNFIVYNSSGC